MSAPARVERRPRQAAPQFERPIDRVLDQFRAHVVGHRPAGEPPATEIEDGGHSVESAVSSPPPGRPEVDVRQLGGREIVSRGPWGAPDGLGTSFSRSTSA
ncbi:MAG: hypothetical protein ACYCTL_06945 [Acidimicrobiales bacterium]